MAIRIDFRPAALSGEILHRLDAECFPQEPMASPALADALAGDNWVAWEGAAPIGFACLIRRADVSWLSRIGTVASHRRRGVASALLRSVLAHCRRIGLPDTMLIVLADNGGAIALYERFGFRAVESISQFMLADPRERLRGEAEPRLAAIPIVELPPASWPRFPREWSAIASMHRPPDTQVLVFRRGDETVGYCRLAPRFPGCFPFVVDRPAELLLPALRSIRDRLDPLRPALKLTVWDEELARACREAGMTLHYELRKMLRGG